MSRLPRGLIINHTKQSNFLIGISPTGFATFLSDCYSGRSSNEFMTAGSGFYDCLDLYDEVMTDRVKIMSKFRTRSVPLCARVKAQMTKAECKTAKDIANLRIRVERAINRIKAFRILKSILSIPILHSIDDIVKTCAALCNLKPLLFKDSIKA